MCSVPGEPPHVTCLNLLDWPPFTRPPPPPSSSSRDCPIFYMRKKVQKDLDDQEKLVSRFGW